MENERDAFSEPALDLAGFPDRVLAWSADAALFYAGYFLSFNLFFPNYPIVLRPATGAWWALWTAAFLLYQAYFSAEGRASLGKLLAGIRIVDTDGSDLSLDRALIRTLFYPLSAIAGLGFLWMFFDRNRQCWHDMAAGSVVVRFRPRTALGGGLATAGATACLLVLGLAGLWRNVWADRYENVMTTSYAYVGLNELGRLEKLQREKTGAYADNIFDLAPLTSDPQRFLADMANLFDLESFEITVAPESCTITARARDDDKTAVRLTVP